MTPLETYRASDRRVYNGAPCSDMQREWTHTEKLLNRMQKADPTSRCTYFPVEGEYLVFTNCYPIETMYVHGMPRILTGNFHESKQEALIEAINILEK